ncbi:MAG: TrkA family potassium uptake protein [Dehalococcoidales bacterium]|nr:TrkA family potassium uptake protein [Dehalococcoidales bacterium]
MYIIVVGGGRIGYYLSRALLSELHEVLVVEKDARVCEAICDELGSVCLRGDGCETTTLAEAGTGRADMLIAVTGDDEDNLVTCQLAKHKFNVPRTIARIGNPKNETIFKKLGIDVTVSSTNIILENIEAEVPTHPLTHLLTIRDKGLELVEVKIPPGAPAAGKAVKELALPSGTILSLVIPEKRRPVVPTDTTIIQAGDQVIALIAPEAEEALRIALRGS